MANQLPIVPQGSVTSGALPACTVGPDYGFTGQQLVSQVIISTAAAAATITINGVSAFVIPINTCISLPIYPTGTNAGRADNIDPTTWSTNATVVVSYVVS